MASFVGVRVRWMAKKTMLAGLRLTILLVLFLGSVLPYDQKSDDLTEDVISSLSRVLDFYDRDYKSINLDGIFGLRVAQGALLSIINNVQDGQLSVEDNVLNQVKELYNNASLTAKSALPFLQRSSPQYFRKFRKQVSDPWLNFKPFTNKKLVKQQYKPQSRRNVINFDEGTSDQCMTELTGTAPGSDGSQPCHISDKCWGLISAEGTEGYTLTHQALFFQLGELQGCTPVLLKRLEQSNIKGGLEGIYSRICSEIYPQMTAIEQKRTLDRSSYHKDLFMEQAMVCGSMGYRDFLSAARLRKILSWQRGDGCFGAIRSVHQDEDETEQFSESDNNDPRERHSEFIGNSDMNGNSEKLRSPFGNFKKSLEYEYSHVLRKPLSMRTMRSLLVEKKLKDGCMSHVTGVATGLLGVYLRWVLYSQEQPFQKHNDMETKKLFENPVQSENAGVYINDNLADVIALKEKQRQKRQKKDETQSAHLMQRRKAAMLDKTELHGERNVDGREGTGFVAWRMFAFGIILFVVLMILGKGVKRMSNVVKVTPRIKKKTAHVI